GPPADPPDSLPEAAAAAGAPPPPLTVAGLPEPVADLCRRCRSPDPARRPAAAEVATVLAEAAGSPVPAAHTLPLVATAPATPAGSPPGQTASAWPAGRAEVGRPGSTPATQVDPAPPTPRRGGRLALAAVGVVVLLVLGLVLVVALRPDESGTSAG